MNKYYLHNGHESSGPFDLEEIKTRQITRSTLVWCEGMEDWTTAGEVPELKRILFSVPPPINSMALKPVTPTVDTNSGFPKSEKEQKEHRKIVGLDLKQFFIVSGIFILIVFTYAFNYYQDSRRAELDQKNGQTDTQNLQYQKIELEIQNNKIAEEERIEQERIAAEKKQARDQRLLEIRDLLSVNFNNLENAKNRLNEASGFQLLRTPEEKEEEMSRAQNEVDRWAREIETLQKEATQLNQY
jgi:hypothetical protein